MQLKINDNLTLNVKKININFFSRFNEETVEENIIQSCQIDLESVTPEQYENFPFVDFSNLVLLRMNKENITFTGYKYTHFQLDYNDEGERYILTLEK